LVKVSPQALLPVLLKVSPQVLPQSWMWVLPQALLPVLLKVSRALISVAKASRLTWRT